MATALWEHLIRDEGDYQAHMDYVHINPLKHRLVRHIVDWPHSTLHRLVALGVYPADWAGDGFSATLNYWD
jgi:putative transposase